MAGSEQASARARRRPGRAAARARQVPLDLLLEPRRVLHGARRRPARPGHRPRQRRLPGRPHAAAGARRRPRGGPRADGRAVEALAGRARPGTRGGGDRHRHRRGRERGRARGARGALLEGDLPGADAARGRARTALPLHLGPLALARRQRARPRLGRGALRAGQGARDAAAIREGRRAQPDAPARGRDLALPSWVFPGMDLTGARRLPRDPRRRHRDLGRRGRPARGRRERAPQAPLRRRRPARGFELDLAGDGGAADRAAVGPARTPSTRPRAARPARDDAALQPRPPRPEVRAVGAADAAPAREADRRGSLRGDRLRRHRRAASLRLVRDQRRGVRARGGQGSRLW